MNDENKDLEQKDSSKSASQQNSEQPIESFQRFEMDSEGKVHGKKERSIALGNNRTFIILGWVSAALAAFISPLFAISGITFGVLLNKQVRGSGNTIIITNIVLALLNIIFGLVLAVAVRRILSGY